MRGKGKCYMAYNSYRMHNVEKYFWGYRSIHTVKNDFWTTSMKFLPMGEGSSSAMPYHFNPPYEKHGQTKNMWKYQYEDRYYPLKL